MQNRKRILSVTICKMLDDSPDTSWLGEYSRRKTSDFSIDRSHSEDCIENDTLQKEKLERIADYIESLSESCSMHSNPQEMFCYACNEETILECAANEIRELAECDCGGSHLERNSLPYFNPSFNYVNDQGKPSDGLTAEEVRKYVRQDYDRMESLNDGHWCFIGLRAEAQVQTGTDVVQRITSGGLYGIESDSDRSHFDETIREELATLKTELFALGFGKRAIATAFKPENITEKND